VPSKGATIDHRDVQQRQDVLVYSSEVLTDTVEVVGRVFVQLWAASDARDADFTAKLLDVYPDGRALLLGPQELGAKRARYRFGYDREVPLEPGRVEEYTIELFDVGHGFLPGHRIRVEIASSGSPYIHPNPGTGRPIASDTSFVVANQTIYHDRTRPSRIILPVIGRSTVRP
jgi:putative CocE/NonD family hydrolase